MAENGTILELRHLVHEFPGGKRGLDDISVQFRSGEFTVLAGPNGSGKTVLMRHLNGLARPSSGDVRLRGESIFENLSLTRRSVGLVFQDADAQIVGQTVERDVAFGPENLKLSRSVIHRRVSEALQATGLVGFNQRRPHSLSGGEKRRLAVAGVLAMKPDILVLDEPFTGLDWPGCADLIEVLETLHGGGTGIILITHDLDKILGHADRLLLMNGGRIAADGTPQEIIGVVESLGIRRPSGSISTMTWKRKPPHA